jgi:hypothetical protein
MFIPLSIVKNGDFSKASNRLQKATIFQDKIVNKKLSPLLYNIELGLQEINIATQNIDPSKKTTIEKVSADRAYRAKEMLIMNNIRYENISKNYSLLQEQQENNEGLQNVNIMDKEQFEQTFNKKIQASDKFSSENDPFYNLDESESETSKENYMQEKDVDGTLMLPPDLSKIASSFAVLNLSPNYKGQSKYFIKQKKN